MAEEKEMVFSARCKWFFGFLPEQNITGFMAELKALTWADKLEFHELFNKAGMPTSMPKQQT
jgi:hypothetical protein